MTKRGGSGGYTYTWPEWILRMLRFRGCFWGHLVFMTFHNRILVVFIFDEISKGMPVTLEKKLGEYIQRLHFWNQWVPLIKMHCRVRYLFDFDLNIRSGQVWGLTLVEMLFFNLILNFNTWSKKKTKTFQRSLWTSPKENQVLDLNLLLSFVSQIFFPWVGILFQFMVRIPLCER